MMPPGGAPPSGAPPSPPTQPQGGLMGALGGMVEQGLDAMMSGVDPAPADDAAGAGGGDMPEAGDGEGPPPAPEGPPPSEEPPEGEGDGEVAGEEEPLEGEE